MFFLFTEKVIGIVLLMECMYYIMAIVYVRIVSRFIQVTLDKGLYSAEKNSEIPILIQVKNKENLDVSEYIIDLKENKIKKK